MRRNDTSKVGDLAEQEVERLLLNRGWVVRNLNEQKRNYPTYDLVASKQGLEIFISVKAARAKRELRLGHPRSPCRLKDESFASPTRPLRPPPRSLCRLKDESFIFSLIPLKKGEELDFSLEKYELWIVPGYAREDALNVHRHYHQADPDKAFERGQTIMLKDKVDRVGGRSISGSAFQRWRTLFKDAWHLLPAKEAPELVGL